MAQLGTPTVYHTLTQLGIEGKRLYWTRQFKSLFTETDPKSKAETKIKLKLISSDAALQTKLSELCSELEAGLNQLTSKEFITAASGFTVADYYRLFKSHMRAQGENLSTLIEASAEKDQIEETFGTFQRKLDEAFQNKIATIIGDANLLQSNKLRAAKAAKFREGTEIAEAEGESIADLDEIVAFPDQLKPSGSTWIRAVKEYGPFAVLMSGSRPITMHIHHYTESDQYGNPQPRCDISANFPTFWGNKRAHCTQFLDVIANKFKTDQTVKINAVDKSILREFWVQNQINLLLKNGKGLERLSLHKASVEGSGFDQAGFKPDRKTWSMYNSRLQKLVKEHNVQLPRQMGESNTKKYGKIKTFFEEALRKNTPGAGAHPAPEADPADPTITITSANAPH